MNCFKKSFIVVLFLLLFTVVVNSGTLFDERFAPREPLIFNGAAWDGTSSHSACDPQLALGDMDNDGDCDIFMYEVYPAGNTNQGYFSYYKNTGTPESYIFNTRVKNYDFYPSDAC